MTDYGRIIREAVQKERIVVLASPTVKYHYWVLTTCGILSGMFSRICFLSLLKSYRTRLQEFDDYNKHYGGSIKRNNFFFIDGIEKIREFQSGKNVARYLTRPKMAVEDFLYSITTKHTYLYTLTDNNRIYQKIMSTIWDKHLQVLFIDSLPILSQYMSAEELFKMMHMITSRLQAFKCKGVFPLTIDKNSKALLREIQGLVDEIVVVK
jgi:hypothetical protein